MPAGDIETYFEKGQWKNWVQDAKEDIGEPHASKEEAVAEGREAAQQRGVEHIIRDEDAAVEDRVDYARDREKLPREELRDRAHKGFVERHEATSPLSTPDE
jgi:hypothetical protein